MTAISPQDPIHQQLLSLADNLDSKAQKAGSKGKENYDKILIRQVGTGISNIQFEKKSLGTKIQIFFHIGGRKKEQYRVDTIIKTFDDAFKSVDQSRLNDSQKQKLANLQEHLNKIFKHKFPGKELKTEFKTSLKPQLPSTETRPTPPRPPTKAPTPLPIPTSTVTAKAPLTPPPPPPRPPTKVPTPSPTSAATTSAPSTSTTTPAPTSTEQKKAAPPPPKPPTKQELADAQRARGKRPAQSTAAAATSASPQAQPAATRKSPPPDQFQKSLMDATKGRVVPENVHVLSSKAQIAIDQAAAAKREKEQRERAGEQAPVSSTKRAAPPKPSQSAQRAAPLSSDFAQASIHKALVIQAKQVTFNQDNTLETNFKELISKELFTNVIDKNSQDAACILFGKVFLPKDAVPTAKIIEDIVRKRDWNSITVRDLHLDPAQTSQLDKLIQVATGKKP